MKKQEVITLMNTTREAIRASKTLEDILYSTLVDKTNLSDNDILFDFFFNNFSTAEEVYEKVKTAQKKTIQNLKGGKVVRSSKKEAQKE